MAVLKGPWNVQTGRYISNHLLIFSFYREEMRLSETKWWMILCIHSVRIEHPLHTSTQHAPHLLGRVGQGEANSPRSPGCSRTLNLCQSIPRGRAVTARL